MAITYNALVTELQILTQFNANDPNFLSNLPSAINYAEDRISRELNLLNTQASNSTLALTAGTRIFDMTPANINVLRDVNIITPVGTPADSGTRNPCVISDVSFLDWTFGNSTLLGQPVNFALLDDKTLLFGPFPDQAYTVELIGTVRLTPLSATNQTTWVSTYLQDLLIAASMIFLSAFMRNFGQQSDDPRMAVSWETQFGSLRDSASVEDARRKFQSVGWTSETQQPTNPVRT